MSSLVPIRFVPYMVPYLEVKATQPPYFASLTDSDGSTERSPDFPTHSGLLLWLAGNRNGRACTTNMIGACNFPTPEGQPSKTSYMRYFEEGV